MGIDRNSLVSHLTGYANALSRDIKFAYLSHSDWERDFSRLRHELARKGSRILTLDMPALGKHFDKCLDRGSYKPSRLYLGRVPSKGPQVPVFLRDLYLQVFDLEGKLRDTPNPEVIFLLRTLFMSAKKLRLPYSNRSLHNEVHNFLRIEQEMRRPSLTWDDDYLFSWDLSDGPDMQSGRHGGVEGREESFFLGLDGNLHFGTSSTVQRELNLGDALDPTVFPDADGRNPYRVAYDALLLCQQVADIVATQFGNLFQEEENELPKHGPGATAEGGKHTNKYAFHNWPRKLQATFPADYYASPNLGQGLESGSEVEMGHSEVPSRLIAVPKTQKGPRLIAAEPIAHQWTQQLIRNQLEGRLANTALRRTISFRDQRPSAVAALRGSVDGSLATIDLSSASDRLACWLVERMFRANHSILIRLHACRTRWLTYENEQGRPEYIRLNKFAPMGSAVTFPVQSIIYAIIAVTAVLIEDEKAVTSRSVEVAARQVRVFGDDIIVPRRAFRLTTKLLGALGLLVNDDKTFGEGNFRESCGMDAWRGDDVTPPYLLEGSPCNNVTRLGAAIAVRNNYYRKGFWNIAYWLESQISRYLKWIPDTPAMLQTVGRASFLGWNDSMCRKRYNERLQREEVRVLLPHRKVYRGPMTATQRLLQWFIEVAFRRPNEDQSQILKWESGWTKREDVSTRPGWVPRDIVTA